MKTIDADQFCKIMSQMDTIGLIEVEHRTDAQHLIFETFKDAESVIIKNKFQGDLEIKF